MLHSDSKKRNKKNGGFSLIEIVFAVMVFGTFAVAVVGVFGVSAFQAMDASSRNMASIEAQLQMELLIGRTWEGDLENPAIWDTSGVDSICGNFTIVRQFAHILEIGTPPTPVLTEVTVRVHRLGSVSTDAIAYLTGVINVVPGGFAIP